MISEGLELLREGNVWKLLQEAKRAVPRRVLGRKTFVPYRFYFQYHTAENRFLNYLRYKCPPDPYRPIYVNPSSIEFETKAIQERDGLGQIIEGDWDRENNIRAIEQNNIVRGLKQRFVEGRSWENTAYYTAKRDDFESKEAFFQIRCEFVEDLYRTIKKEGYRPNYEASHTVPEEEKNRTKTRRYQHELEPLVAIGRNGGIYWTDGFHRLAIAQILELETIPVQVVARHQQWQQIREKVYAAIQNENMQKLSSDLQSHPDLQEFYEGNQ